MSAMAYPGAPDTEMQRQGSRTSQSSWICLSILGSISFVVGTVLMICGAASYATESEGISSNLSVFWALIATGIPLMIIGASCMAAARRMRINNVIRTRHVVLPVQYFGPHPGQNFLYGPPVQGQGQGNIGSTNGASINGNMTMDHNLSGATLSHQQFLASVPEYYAATYPFQGGSQSHISTPMTMPAPPPYESIEKPPEYEPLANPTTTYFDNPDYQHDERSNNNN